MNRYNCRTRPGLAKALPTKGYPWWRLYVQMGSEKIAEETPVGIPVKKTQDGISSNFLHLRFFIVFFLKKSKFTYPAAENFNFKMSKRHLAFKRSFIPRQPRSTRAKNAKRAV
jgi:hypothetical protein